MRRYETIVILDPDISEEERAPVFDRISDTIAQGNGFLVLFDEWGTRKLAYEIKKKPRGHYTRIDYCGTGIIVDEIERFFRIDDRVMKYLTVLLDENADVDQLKEDIARAESEKNKTAAEKAEEAKKVEEKDAAADKPPADTVETEAKEPAEPDQAVTTESETEDTETSKED
jgi:small subunit ribosomal protein S6